MDTQQVVRLLTIANNDLLWVQWRCEKLKREEASLKGGNQNSARTLQELSDLISTTRSTLEQYDLSCKERRLELDNLNRENTRLKAFVNDFQNNNDEYIKIKQTIKREVESILTARRQLLKFAVLSIFESLLKDPRKFYALYHNMSSSSSDKSPSSSFSSKTTGIQQYDYVPFMNEQNSPIIDYSNEEICEKILLDQSEEIYDKMVQDLTNKTVTDVESDMDSSLSSSPRTGLSDVQKDSTQKLAAYTYRKEEEHTFIQSEGIDNEYDNKDHGKRPQ